jgi:diguanylate cyclase (GGDEF)-like protein
LYAADESFSSRYGLRVRDNLTGLRATEYWIHGLELRHRRVIFRGTPVTCLVFRIRGLKELREQQGPEKANDVLVRTAALLKNNVRCGSIVCRYEHSSFAVALYRCSSKRGMAEGERIAANIWFEVLDPTHVNHGIELEIDWASAIMPGDASTPVQLLRVADWKLKRQDRAAKQQEAEAPPFDPESGNGNLPAAA